MNNSEIDSSVEKSHSAHARHIDELIAEQEPRLSYTTDKSSGAYRLNIRTLDIMRPFWQTPHNTWLTIADYNGLEANYLINKEQHVTASDISDTFLCEAHRRGAIDDYRRINVENIECANDSFDYVSCREAFHHFPRAYLGLYEMLRVARKGVIMVEPLDMLLRMPEMMLLKNILDRANPQLINRIWKNRFSFETVGNYVFKISEREIEKVAMGIGLPCIAFKGINMALWCSPSKAWAKLRRRNALCRLHLIPYSALCCVLFKEMPEPQTIQSMKTEGYRIIMLPRNPYLL